MKFQIRPSVKKNSPLILTVLSAAGTIGTAYLASRASFKASELIRQEEMYGERPLGPLDKKEKAKLVWKLYIPTAASAAGTIACSVGANRIGTQKTIAAQTALAFSQQAYSEYREKVVEQIGVKKEQKIQDTIREEKVQANPPAAIVVGSGTVLCCELYTGRYFNSDMEALKSAVNEINQKINKHDFASRDDLYYILGLQCTTTSGQSGWDSSRHLELDITTTMSPDGRPCLAFDYNYIVPF